MSAGYERAITHHKTSGIRVKRMKTRERCECVQFCDVRPITQLQESEPSEDVERTYSATLTDDYMAEIEGQYRADARGSSNVVAEHPQ